MRVRGALAAVCGSVVVVVVVVAVAPATAGPAPMRGPFNDLTLVCAPCTTTAKLTRPGAPLREVRVVFAGDASVAPTPSNQLEHWLAIRTDAGWFFQDLGSSGVICGGRSQSHVSRSATGLVAHDVVGDAAPEVELDVDTDVIGGGPQIRDRNHYVCALDADPAGAPRCTDLFVRRYADHAADSWDYQLAIDRKRGVARLTHDSYGHADASVSLVP